MAQKRSNSFQTKLLLLFFVSLILAFLWRMLQFWSTESPQSPSNPHTLHKDLDNTDRGSIQMMHLLLKNVNKSIEVDPKLVRLALLSTKNWNIERGSMGINVGGIHPESLQFASSVSAVMGCSGHVRIVNGVLFYRFGGFYTTWYQTNRFLQSLKLIQDAIDMFKLKDLSVELIINNCDIPRSYHSGYFDDQAGFPVFSPFVSPDSTDIPIPDALDFDPNYGHNVSVQVGWEEKVELGVFRGATTNFELTHCNWGSNPRVRLHQMAARNERLYDARVSRWSHVSRRWKHRMRREGFALGKRMNFSTFNAFKYQIVVDGGAGSSRTCGVMRSNQLIIRQKSYLIQFFEPLMQPGVHWLQVRRMMSDLRGAVQWARSHDAAVQGMVQRANQLAESVCSWRGRVGYWAVLLLAYQRTLTHTHHLTHPSNLCRHRAPTAAMDLPWLEVDCESEEVERVQQHPCIFYCTGHPMDPDKMIWLTKDGLQDVRRIGPGATQFD